MECSGQDRHILTLSLASEIPYSAALEKRAFDGRAPEKGHQALCRKVRLGLVRISSIVRIYWVHGSQPVAGFRHAHVEGMLLQPAVRLHQDPIGSAPVGGTPGFDQVVQKAEAPDRPACRGGTRTALAGNGSHDRSILTASNTDLL
jgi:hypothetical protein